MAAFAPFIGKVLGVKPVHIEFQAKGKQRSLNMPGIGEMQITALEGAGGRDITIENQPFTAVPNQPATVWPSQRNSHSMITDGTGTSPRKVDSTVPSISKSLEATFCPQRGG